MTSTVNANFSDVASKVNPPQGMSIADMLKMASGAQAYQQAQQLNPLALEKARADLITAQVGAEKAKRNLEPEVAKALANAQTAIFESNTKQLENQRSQLANHSKNLLNLLNQKEPLTPDSLKEWTMEQLKNTNATPEAIKQELSFLPKDGKDKELRAWVAKHATNSLTAEAQLEKLFPPIANVNVGGKIVPITTGSPELATNAPGQQLEGGVKTTISPQLIQDPITKQFIQVGGDNMPTNPMAPGQQAASSNELLPPLPPGMPHGAPSGVLPSLPQSRPQAQAQGNLAQMANESPENFNARVAEIRGVFNKAIDQYNNQGSQYGYIPMAKQLNSTVLDLLKDKSVNTGSVADYLSKKTNKATLNPKEQDLAKYLEQRVQNLQPRTDQAAVNLKNAYGSFNLDKEALKDLIRQDNAWVTAQDLQAKGILHSGGSQINPNLGAVANFNQQFTQYANNPDLMKYISLVGEDQKAHLDKDDVSSFNRFVGPMSIDKRHALEAQRQELLKLVRGQ